MGFSQEQMSAARGLREDFTRGTSGATRGRGRGGGGLGGRRPAPRSVPGNQFNRGPARSQVGQGRPPYPMTPIHHRNPHPPPQSRTSVRNGGLQADNMRPRGGISDTMDVDTAPSHHDQVPVVCYYGDEQPASPQQHELSRNTPTQTPPPLQVLPTNIPAVNRAVEQPTSFIGQQKTNQEFSFNAPTPPPAMVVGSVQQQVQQPVQQPFHEQPPSNLPSVSSIQSSAVDQPIIWNYNGDSPPRVYKPQPVPDSPPKPLVFAPYKPHRMTMPRQFVELEEDTGPSSQLPPVISGPYLPLNAHPFNSVPGTAHVRLSTPGTFPVNDGPCTCSGPREDTGLISSRHAAEQDIIFMPNRFTDVCPVHGNEHIYGQGYRKTLM